MSSIEPTHEINDAEGKLTPWGKLVLELLRPMSTNKHGTFREIIVEWIVWDEVDNGPDSSRWGVCSICNHDGIRRAYTIRNKYTDHRVESIGSVCIQGFMDNPS